MKKATITPAPINSSGSFSISIANTSMSQRSSLEEIMVNLATALSIEEIHKQKDARGSVFYRPTTRGFAFQSATNTILEMSRKLAELKA